MDEAGLLRVDEQEDVIEGHVLGEEPFIDAGDRVIVKPEIAEIVHARLPNPAAAGMRGRVISNDGYGLCTVELENGALITAWNAYDLERYVEEA